MNFQIIPTHADPFYDQITQIDGSEYLLKFRYNSRDKCWRLRLCLPDGTGLGDELKLTCLVNLLTPYQHDPRVPQGWLGVVPSGADDSPPGLADLVEGARCELRYLTPENIAVLTA